MPFFQQNFRTSASPQPRSWCRSPGRPHFFSIGDSDGVPRPSQCEPVHTQEKFGQRKPERPLRAEHCRPSPGGLPAPLPVVSDEAAGIIRAIAAAQRRDPIPSCCLVASWNDTLRQTNRQPIGLRMRAPVPLTRWRNQRTWAAPGWYRCHNQASSTMTVRSRRFPALSMPCSRSVPPLL